MKIVKRTGKEAILKQQEGNENEIVCTLRNFGKKLGFKVVGVEKLSPEDDLIYEINYDDKSGEINRQIFSNGSGDALVIDGKDEALYTRFPMNLYTKTEDGIYRDQYGTPASTGISILDPSVQSELTGAAKAAEDFFRNL